MVFDRIDLSDFKIYKEFFTKNNMYNNYYGSDLNFKVLYLWQQFQSLQDYVCSDYIIIKGNSKHHTFFLPPIAKSEEDFIKGINAIKDYCAKAGLPVFINYLSASLKKFLVKNFAVKDVNPDRNSFEYIYLSEDLISYQGKKYHDKKNLLKQFEKNSFEIRKYTDADYDSVKKILSGWNGSHNESELENSAIESSLKSRHELDIMCDLIFIDGQAQAFTIGAICENNLGIILFEKANIKYKGIYAAINNYFVKNNFSSCQYVSLQEDMGTPGLRQSKMSYNPIFLEEKFNAVLK